MAKSYFMYEFTDKEFKELLGLDSKDKLYEVYSYPGKIVVTTEGPPD